VFEKPLPCCWVGRTLKTSNRPCSMVMSKASIKEWFPFTGQQHKERCAPEQCRECECEWEWEWESESVSVRVCD
jgi:hypothetical protein